MATKYATHLTPNSENYNIYLLNKCIQLPNTYKVTPKVTQRGGESTHSCLFF